MKDLTELKKEFEALWENEEFMIEDGGDFYQESTKVWQWITTNFTPRGQEIYNIDADKGEAVLKVSVDGDGCLQYTPITPKQSVSEVGVIKERFDGEFKSPRFVLGDSMDRVWNFFLPYLSPNFSVGGEDIEKRLRNLPSSIKRNGKEYQLLITKSDDGYNHHWGYWSLNYALGTYLCDEEHSNEGDADYLLHGVDSPDINQAIDMVSEWLEKLKHCCEICNHQSSELNQDGICPDCL